MVSSLVLIGAILVAVLAGFYGGLLWTARPFRSARSNYDSHFSASAVIERVNAEYESEDQGDYPVADAPEWLDEDSGESEPDPVERTERIVPVDVQLYGGAHDSNPGLFRYNLSVPSPARVPDAERTTELPVVGPLVPDARPGHGVPPMRERSTGRHALIEGGRR
ncbi:hypothetical protein [Haloechinothrix salitolerans]|uniref:Uncharacterized protein n=1 Tax=Haloechinothrix salitolerans TaxID=926830 RepID=A0ABW2C667_9PSEU